MQIRCKADHCKTKACSISVDPSIGLLLIHADVCYCGSLITAEYISVQEEDSKVGEMIYLMRRLTFKQFLINESISIRNTREIHEIVRIATDWLFYPNWPKL